jgi:undecaprenyl-diphosphatase
MTDDTRRGRQWTRSWVGLADGRIAAMTMGLLAAFFGLQFALVVVLGSFVETLHDREAHLLDSLGGPFLHGLASPGLDAAMTAATTLASAPVVPVLLVLATAGLLAARQGGAALFLNLSLGGSVVLNQLLKVVFHRARPDLHWATAQTEYSFPSGHAQNGLVFYLALALIAWAIAGRRAGVAAVAVAAMLVLLIGASRIYLGYHYPTDVIGGYVIGAIWLVAVAIALRAADPGHALESRLTDPAR